LGPKELPGCTFPGRKWSKNIERKRVPTIGAERPGDELGVTDLQTAKRKGEYVAEASWFLEQETPGLLPPGERSKPRGGLKGHKKPQQNVNRKKKGNRKGLQDEIVTVWTSWVHGKRNWGSRTAF